jgi:DNA-binding LacI/PurR family transcriptional regulator
VQQMLARQVDGLILATTTRRDPIIDHCSEHSVPVVSVNRSEDIERTSIARNNGVSVAMGRREM